MNYGLRLQKVRTLLETLACESLLIEDPTNLLYLTGLELSLGKLLISSKEAYLIVDGRYLEICQSQDLYQVLPLHEWNWESQFQGQSIRSLGFDSQNTSYQTFETLSSFMKDLKIELLPLTSPLERLRLIKDEDEIAYLRQAAKLNVKGYQQIISLLRTGITEEELAFELEFFWKKQGAKKLSFDSIIAFGPNSSMPHYRAGNTALKNDEHVLIDIGVVYQHYHSDMTRVVYWGTPSDRIQTIYRIVEGAKQKAMELCRPGTLIGALDQTARSFIASKNYGEYFTHSLGHGVGLDIHETPLIRTKGPYSHLPLEAGMVITIEPGIYLPGVGGVRLEDTLLITENGYENLTR